MSSDTYGPWDKGFARGYMRGRLEAAEAVRALAEDWPAHHTDYVVKTALARAATAAEGNVRGFTVP